MPAQALAPRLLLSPLDILRGVLETVRAAVEHAAYDLRVRPLEALIGLIETETKQVIATATPESINERALDLGRRHWPYWRDSLQLASDLAANMDLHVESALTFGVEGWKLVAEHVEEYLPLLPVGARRDLRATAYLALAALEREHLGLVAAEQVAALFETPSAPDDDAVRFLALVQILTVAGISAERSPRSIEAAAHALWLLISQQVPEDSAEDAFWSAEVAESNLEPDASVGLDEFLAQPRGE